MDYVLLFVEIYENTQDAEIQRQLIKKITDTIALRPRINFELDYFKVSYEFETKIIQQKTELMRKLIMKQLQEE